MKTAKESRAAKGQERSKHKSSGSHRSQQPVASHANGDDDDEDDVIDDIEPSHTRRPAAALRPAVASANSELWTDKYAPQTIDALAVHRTGVDRVRNWLQESLRALQQTVRRSAPSVLVLKGPPGSGKSALIKLLATELNCSVREWSSPASGSTWGSEERLGPGEWRDQQRVAYEGALEPLEHFLLGTAKYSALPGLSLAAAKKPSNTGSSSQQQIIMVDELPQLNKVEHRERFHALIRALAERTRSPAVFLLSSHRQSGSGGFGDATTTSTYFPESLLGHTQLTEQKLLEVNKTSLEKTLRAINLAETTGVNSRSKGVSVTTIKAIAASCHGDVRAAVHSLQFESVGSRAGGAAAGKKVQTKRKAAGSSSAAQSAADGLSLGARDVRLDMFRALGKILYNKRLDPTDEKVISAADAARHVAAEASVRTELRRPPPKDGAESVVDGYDVDWPKLCDQLQQNYLGFFTVVEDAEKAAVGLSDGALIGGWTEDRPSHELSCGMAASATVRAMRWSNTSPAEATFRPFHYKSNFAQKGEQDANWRGADSFLAASGVAGQGEATVRSRQYRFELANYVQFMSNNGGLAAAKAAAAGAAAAAATAGGKGVVDDEMDEVEDDIG